MKKQNEIEKIIFKIESASTFNEMGEWTLALNRMDINEMQKRALFYEINFPFNAKVEFINGQFYIQEYPLEDK